MGVDSHGLLYILPPVLYQKSFRTVIRSSKHNFDFSFLIKIFIGKLYMYIL
jgi:hypothetical protein